MIRNEKSTHFFKREIVSEPTKVKMKSDKYYFNSTKVVIIHNKKSTFISPIYSFPLVGNMIAYTLNQGTNRENYFNHTIYKEKLPILAGNEHRSIQFSLHRPRLFQLSIGNCTGLFRQRRISKCLFPRRHNTY